MDGDELPINDRWKIARLKYLRNRSLSNPTYRDAQFVRKFVANPRSPWDADARLEPLRNTVESTLNDYDRLAKRGDSLGAEAAWQVVLDGIDNLISEGERIQGHKIKPRA
ncbi:MAG: hypothetical protein IVW52_18165 [Acidimicrobiales bacterium]|nr:hypothetical protein [Acidimicrobiales bacterium]